MRTLEMMNKANENGETYISCSLQYKKTSGFTNKGTGKPWGGRAFETVNKLFELDGWEPVKELVGFTTAYIDCLNNGNSYSDGHNLIKKSENNNIVVHRENDIVCIDMSSGIILNGDWYIVEE